MVSYVWYLALTFSFPMLRLCSHSFTLSLNSTVNFPKKLKNNNKKTMPLAAFCAETGLQFRILVFLGYTI
jgi:hypothetical protein